LGIKMPSEKGWKWRKYSQNPSLSGKPILQEQSAHEEPEEKHQLPGLHPTKCMLGWPDTVRVKGFCSNGLNILEFSAIPGIARNSGLIIKASSDFPKYRQLYISWNSYSMFPLFTKLLLPKILRQLKPRKANMQRTLGHVEVAVLLQVQEGVSSGSISNILASELCGISMDHARCFLFSLWNIWPFITCCPRHYDVLKYLTGLPTSAFPHLSESSRRLPCHCRSLLLKSLRAGCQMGIDLDSLISVYWVAFCGESVFMTPTVFETKYDSLLHLPLPSILSPFHHDRSRPVTLIPPTFKRWNSPLSTFNSPLRNRGVENAFSKHLQRKSIVHFHI